MANDDANSGTGEVERLRQQLVEKDATIDRLRRALSSARGERNREKRIRICDEGLSVQNNDQALREHDFAWIEAVENATLERDRLAAEMLTPRVFSRLVEWLREDPIRPATGAFTAGIERQIAYALEIDVLPEVKRLRLRLQRAEDPMK